MSYFDHVRCTACKAMLDPESLATRAGQGLSCPRCGAPLSLTDLFGLKDAFQEEEEETPSFDDLVPAPRPPPPQRARPASRAPAASAPAARKPASRPPARAARSAAPAPSTALVRAPAPGSEPEPEPPPADSSALAAMRALKRK